MGDVHDHHYRAGVSWTGSTGVGYEHYDRAHTVTARPDHPTSADGLALSADPAFRGDPAQLNPEQLFVLAASSCQLLSFLAVAARARLNVISYVDDAEGEMPAGNKPVWITRIMLRPRVVVAVAGQEAGTDTSALERRITHLLHIAHKECYIANSVRTDIAVDPEIAFHFDQPIVSTV